MGAIWGSPTEDAGLGAPQQICNEAEPTHKVLIDGVLYALYEPKDGANVDMDIIFFHGLQPKGNYKDAWLRTWQSDTDAGPVCWPERFLSEDFPRARVLSVSYDSAASKRHDGGRQDLPSVGEQLGGHLLRKDVGSRPLLLVGHSLGGLVLKQVCIHVSSRAGQGRDAHEQRRAAAFMANVVGVAFYSTPHAGSRLADLAAVKWATGGDLMPYLETLSKSIGRTNEQFDELVSQRGWVPLGFCEQHATKAGPFHAVVVEEASGMQGMHIKVPIAADHSAVCKPSSKESASYEPLKQYLLDRVQTSQVRGTPDSR